MPTYEYACDSCNNHFDVFQKMSEAPVDVCPDCGKKVRRVLSGGIGVSFKGSGFYVTDSKAARTPDGKTGAPAAKTGTPASGASSGTGSGS